MYAAHDHFQLLGFTYVYFSQNVCYLIMPIGGVAYNDFKFNNVWCLPADENAKLGLFEQGTTVDIPGNYTF